MSNDTESPDFPDFPDFADLPEDANALSTTPAPGSEFAAPEGFRSGFISFVGRPNTGKSTLTNALVGEKIAITADQPETTRHPIRGVVHRPDSQIIVVDTPGCTGRAPCSVSGSTRSSRTPMPTSTSSACASRRTRRSAPATAGSWRRCAPRHRRPR